MHIRAEHLHLFPTILRAIDASRKENASGRPSSEVARSTIARLEEDHDYFMRELAGAMKQLRAASEQPQGNPAAVARNVRETILAVSRRLETHNELEETEVYQWAGAVLPRPEQVALNAKIQTELNNPPPRFREGK